MTKIAILPLKEVPSRCSNCSMQYHLHLDVGIAFGCKLNNDLSYYTKEGMTFDRHPLCPLIEIDIDELKEAARYFDTLNKEDINPYINMNRFNKEYNTIKSTIDKLKGNGGKYNG